MTEKKPHYITPNLLDALGGTGTTDQGVTLRDEGANLWGVEGAKEAKGILIHVLKTSRVAYNLAQALRDQHVPGYENIDLSNVVHAAVLHDITKLYGQDRENLSPELKEKLGIKPDYSEIQDEVDEVGISWLRELGFPEEVCEAIRGHDFPERIVNDPYWKIILLSDYMVGQDIMTVASRLNDVRTRWIDEPKARGKRPRIDEERFDRAEKNIKAVATEVFSALKTTDQQFIDGHNLNNENTETRWERFLRTTLEKGKDARAKRLVNVIFGGRTIPNTD